MNDSPTWDLRLLSPGEAEAVADMTFPVYRHLLALEPAPRHPEQGDTKLAQPVAVVAWRDQEPVGMVLAETPLVEGQFPEMLSLYVKEEARGQGVATALVRRLERVLQERGFSRLTAVYMTGKPSIEAVERVLAKCGWDPPATRAVTLRFTPEEALATPWFGRITLDRSEFEVFPWADLTAEERAEIQRSNAESRWITPGLEPWTHDRHGYERVSSVGLRHKGKVVGWVINHRVSDDTVRFTCSFMRKDLGRRGRIMPLYTVSLQRLRAAGCRTCVFITPVVHRTMVDFVKRRCAPWASFFGETRGTSKNFRDASAALAGARAEGRNGRSEVR
jgi:GNAT superfamily N-acetyltransferase